LTTEDGLHHKKLLRFKEEQNIYITNRMTGYIDNRIYFWIAHPSISFTPTLKRGLIAACPSHHQILNGDQLPIDSTSSSSTVRTSQSTSTSAISAYQSTSSSLPLLRAIKFTPIKSASIGGMETGLTAGAAAGSSTSHKDGTGFDVLAGGASFSTGAPQAPRDDDTTAKMLTMKSLCSTVPP
jgi:hypothetical protein